MKDSKLNFNLNTSVYLPLMLVLQELKVCYGNKPEINR